VICAVSVCLIAAFTVGQSALLTTSIIGGFWYLLKRSDEGASFMGDALIAVLFWATCMKPSLAIIPGALLLGAQAWRPLMLAGFLLAMTWIILADDYGGLLTGLTDYQYLLNHYNNAEFTPFMQRGHETDAQKHATLMIFAVDRMLVMGSCLTLLILRWTRCIDASVHFQGILWTFLLISPYLLPSENWIMCLLIVEGNFWKSKNLFLVVPKLLLLAAVLDMRAGVTASGTHDVYLKWALCAWIVAEWTFARVSTARAQAGSAIAA
jgi:hypothetical protein